MVKKVLVYTISHGRGLGEKPRQMIFDATTRPLLRRACLKILERREKAGDFEMPSKKNWVDYQGPKLREINKMPRGMAKKEALEAYRKGLKEVNRFRQESAFRQRAVEAVKRKNLTEAEKIIMDRYFDNCSIELVEDVNYDG